MKRLLLYLLASMLLVAAVLLAYVYHEYMGEDEKPTTVNQANPVIRKRLNAVVLRTTTTQVANQPKTEVAYTDLDTKETASFVVNDEYRQRLHVGDTITKEKGDKLLFVNQKEGKMEFVPID